MLCADDTGITFQKIEIRWLKLAKKILTDPKQSSVYKKPSFTYRFRGSMKENAGQHSGTENDNRYCYRRYNFRQ